MAVRRPDPRLARQEAAKEARAAALSAWWAERAQEDEYLSRDDYARFEELNHDTTVEASLNAIIVSIDAAAKVAESLSYYGREEYRTWYGPIPDWVEPKGDHDG